MNKIPDKLYFAFSHGGNNALRHSANSSARGKIVLSQIINHIQSKQGTNDDPLNFKVVIVGSSRKFGKLENYEDGQISAKMEGEKAFTGGYMRDEIKVTLRTYLQMFPDQETPLKVFLNQLLDNFEQIVLTEDDLTEILPNKPQENYFNSESKLETRSRSLATNVSVMVNAVRHFLPAFKQDKIPEVVLTGPTLFMSRLKRFALNEIFEPETSSFQDSKDRMLLWDIMNRASFITKSEIFPSSFSEFKKIGDLINETVGLVAGIIHPRIYNALEQRTVEARKHDLYNENGERIS